MDQQEKASFLANPREGAPQYHDSTRAQHHQHRAGPRSPVCILGAITCLLVFLLHSLVQVPLRTTLQHHQTSKPTEPHLSSRSTKHLIEKRIPGEHVVLADCRDRKNVVSSQMAYYVGDPGPVPGDVAVVETLFGQTALWVNTETSALFYNSNVTFKAVIGPKVGEGQFAGTGDNGYGNFTCWQRYKNNLYSYNNDTLCSQVYACNHDAVPAVLPTPGAAAPSSSATPGDAPSGLSQGAMIAIIVAVVGSVLFGIAMGVFWWYWRRTRQRQQQESLASEDGEPKTTDNEPSPPPPTYAAAVLPQSPSITPKFELAPGTLYEMDGQWYRVEMAADNSRYEMDAQSIKKSAGVTSEEVEEERPTTSAGASSPSAAGPTVARTATVGSDSRGNSPVLTPVNVEGGVASLPVAGMSVPVLVPIPAPGPEAENDTNKATSGFK
ncbi:hypothetical protein QBC36DRAFT_203447 [Triangularia setosa]|uniref:SH3 domain-containing protein n=1 Tax=Triangularia setosa TaxID=2587417 RepID=A0AAN6WIU7_9PEZI|nr:hypothetical protein QBC36DRAFT_203447 [Podospora setosa]